MYQGKRKNKKWSIQEKNEIVLLYLGQHMGWSEILRTFNMVLLTYGLLFNIDSFKPEKPLNIEDKWVAIYTIDDEHGDKILSLSESMVNSFCNKIIVTCQACGYSTKSFDSNKKYLIDNFVAVC